MSTREPSVHVVRITPSETVRARRVPGQGKGRWHVTEDFDGPLPADVIEAFEGRERSDR